MSINELAQWVINNRYPKSENEKVSDAEMYNFIIDNLKQPENNGWISVEDRLPETGEEVLVYDCFGQLNEIPELSMSSANYKNGMWYDYLGNIHFYGEDITHWQPLPPPPAKN
jgi:hypothetical protein